MLDGFLVHVCRLMQTAWAAALTPMLDPWWARGDVERVLGVARDAAALVEYAALDRDRTRARRTVRAALAKRPYPLVPITLVAATVDPEVPITVRRWLRHDDDGPALLALLDRKDPDEVPETPLLRAWHAVRTQRADVREAFEAAWQASPDVSAMVFATAAAGLWDLVPPGQRPAAARLLALDGRLATIDELAAAANDAERADIYIAAAPALTAVPAAWVAPILARAATADAQYEEGLITDVERAERRWVAAYCAGPDGMRTLERTAFANAHHAAEVVAGDVERPVEPVSKATLARLEKELAAACADPAARLWRVGRHLDRAAAAGQVDVVRAAIDRLEQARGPLDVYQLEIAQLAYPGRSLTVANQMPFWTSHKRSAAVVALARDGHRAEAARHAELLFQEDNVWFDDLTRVAGLVLASRPDARDRLADAARAVLDALPDAGWLAAPFTGPWRPLPPPVVARSPELEASLAAHDDAATALVYADFLTGRGDPRGELIAFHEAGRLAEAELLLARHAEHFLGPLAQLAHTLDGAAQPAFTWRRGFLATARVGCYADREPAAEALPLQAALDLLLGHPSGALLRELTVTISVIDGRCDFTPLVTALDRHGAPALRALRIGEFSYAGARRPRSDIDFEMSWAKLPVLSPVWPRLSRLERLVLQGSLEEAVLGGIELPALRSLVIMTGGMARENVAAIAGAGWPALEELELWFGRDDYGCTTTLADTAPLLDAARFPRLHTLRLMNADFADELVDPLASAPLLRQLREVSLALGTLSDAGAKRLASHRKRFRHLAVLDVEASCLSDEAADRIARLCGEVRSDHQKDADDRFVSVGE